MAVIDASGYVKDFTEFSGPQAVTNGDSDRSEYWPEYGFFDFDPISTIFASNEGASSFVVHDAYNGTADFNAYSLANHSFQLDSRISESFLLINNRFDTENPFGEIKFFLDVEFAASGSAGFHAGISVESPYGGHSIIQASGDGTSEAVIWNADFQSTDFSGIRYEIDYPIRGATTTLGLSANFFARSQDLDPAYIDASISYGFILPEGVSIQSESGKVLRDVISQPEHIIVLTHGWQPDGEEVQGQSRLPEVRAALEQRLEKEGVRDETLIIEFSWPEAFTETSLNAYLAARNATANAGSRLATELAILYDEISTTTGNPFEPTLHFIGHSLGTMVNAEAAHRITNPQEYPNSDGLISVDQFTILDSPWMGSPSMIVGPPHREFFAAKLDNSNIKYVENFYGNDIPFPDIIDLDPAWGEPIEGAGPCNGQLCAGGALFDGADHREVHTEYARIIGQERNDPFGQEWNAPALGADWAIPIRWNPLLQFFSEYNVAFGDNNDNTLLGGEDSDLIFGENGEDILVGSKGADALFGHFGDDFLAGGEITDFSTSDGGKVYRLYQATLDRAPDTRGFDYWTGELEYGTTNLLGIISGFVNSPEFQATYGALSNADFVTLLYNNVLERAPDAAGLENWVGRLESGTSSEQVVQGFSESAELKNNASIEASAYSEAQTGRIQSEFADDVYRLYEATLDRVPDENGLKNWSGRLADGQDYTTVARGFTNSQEFRNTYGEDISNTQIVTLLYGNVLDRAPDANGLARWVSELNAGTSREAVVRGFAQSQEFRNNTADPFESYMQALGGDTLDGGAGNDTLYGGITADTFVFNASEDGTDRVLQLDAWDTLQFDGFGYGSAADALAHMSVAGSDVRFNDQGVEIIFAGVNLARLNEVEYEFI